jgi:hypothetical protein
MHLCRRSLARRNKADAVSRAPKSIYGNLRLISFASRATQRRAWHDLAGRNEFGIGEFVAIRGSVSFCFSVTRDLRDLRKQIGKR